VRQNTFSASILFVVLYMVTGCNPLPIQPAANTKTDPDPVSEPMTSVPVPTPTTLQLPASARLGSILVGSGAVERNQLTYDELMTGEANGPVDDSAFAPPEEAAMPKIVFEGRLELSQEVKTSGWKLIRDDVNYAADPARFQLPALSLEFVQDGSYLIPVTQGLVFSGSKYWNYIIGPGRIWQENGDQGYSRASFPFTLVERNQNCTHNGVMTFLTDSVHISQMRYQVTQETCLYFKFDMWGQAAATYIPESIPQAEALKAANAAEVANRLPTRPTAALASDFPGTVFSETALTNGISPEDMSLYGLVVNGNNYVSACNTRHGHYAFCENLRLPSYSTAKSAFAAVALMHLGQKYGTGVYDLLIKDYVPEAAAAAGDWSRVTFRNALDMSTGNYEEAGYEVDEGSTNELAFLDLAETYPDKIGYAFRFPNRNIPGQTWIYHTSDTFIATRAMNNYLVKQEGSGADIFNFVRDEVYIPLHLSAGALATLRTGNSLDGAPFGGYGLYWTQDDIAKLAVFLNSQNGAIAGRQILEPGLLAASLQRNPNDRGLNTSGVPAFKYRNGFWAREWTPSENPRFPCTFWSPFMSGYGGITVVLMPNDSIYYYFSDNNEFSWYDAVNEVDKLKPICP
jgi:CubicO group peptidase (beta-lactamase class C family)